MSVSTLETSINCYWLDACPVCAQKCTQGCRCPTNHRWCEKGHKWIRNDDGTAIIEKGYSQEDYLKASSNCLLCGSDEIEGGFVEIDGNSATQKVSCFNCGGSWVDVYELKGVADALAPDGTSLG